MEVRKLREGEIFKVQELVPKEWHVNLIELTKKHYTNKYFYPMAVVEEDDVLAVGNLFMFGDSDSAWLGHILVKTSARRRGIGTLLMKKLIEHAVSKGIKSINLVATKQGEFLYKSLGFKEDRFYYFYKGIFEGKASPFIKQIGEEDRDRIIELDYKITLEARNNMFHEYIFSGYKYQDELGEIRGFFLPKFGQGLVLALDETAGIELIKFKHFKREALTVIPESNKAGIKFLEQEGFELTEKARRMYLGEYTPWLSGCVFGRGTAYTG